MVDEVFDSISLDSSDNIKQKFEETKQINDLFEGIVYNKKIKFLSPSLVSEVKEIVKVENEKEEEKKEEPIIEYQDKYDLNELNDYVTTINSAYKSDRTLKTDYKAEIQTQFDSLQEQLKAYYEVGKTTSSAKIGIDAIIDKIEFKIPLSNLYIIISSDESKSISTFSDINKEINDRNSSSVSFFHEIDEFLYDNTKNINPIDIILNPNYIFEFYYKIIKDDTTNIIK